MLAAHDLTDEELATPEGPLLIEIDEEGDDSFVMADGSEALAGQSSEEPIDLVAGDTALPAKPSSAGTLHPLPCPTNCLV